MRQAAVLLIFLSFWNILNATGTSDWSCNRYCVQAAGYADAMQNIRRTAVRDNNCESHASQLGSLQTTLLVSSSPKDTGRASQAQNQEKKVYPVFYGGAGLPPTDRLTRVSTDVAKDQATNHLDITADYFSFSGTKFYAAIQNRGGGFPTSGSLGTKYFSYMFMLTKPGDADTVWAMTYIHVALGGISPGLYKIVGKKAADLIRIGDISFEIRKDSNLLVMSCDIASLMADPAFAAWYNPANPVLATLSITSKTTVIPFGTTTTDASPKANVYPQKLHNSIIHKADYFLVQAEN